MVKVVHLQGKVSEIVCVVVNVNGVSNKIEDEHQIRSLTTNRSPTNHFLQENPSLPSPSTLPSTPTPNNQLQ